MVVSLAGAKVPCRLVVSGAERSSVQTAGRTTPVVRVARNVQRVTFGTRFGRKAHNAHTDTLHACIQEIHNGEGDFVRTQGGHARSADHAGWRGVEHAESR